METVYETHPNRSGEVKVLPWSVVNEVRTSLAAMRFLLFQVQTGNNYAALSDVASELSRLEALFHDMDALVDQTKNSPCGS